MKQHISLSDLNQLSDKGKERLRRCTQCNVLYIIKTPWKDRGKFCSRDCWYKFQSINRHKQECVVCKKNYTIHPSSSNLRKTCSMECGRKYYGITHRKENNPRWRGGITPIAKKVRGSTKYQQWRAEVIKRDNKCVLCGSTDNLEVDHVIPLASSLELAFNKDNGRVLCKTCHSNIPTSKMGKLNRVDWERLYEAALVN